MWQKELEVCKLLAVEAGLEIMKIYDGGNTLSIEYKGDSSPLTVADKSSNAVIVAGLKRNFPTYAILSEEEMDSEERLKNDYCFIVDPLDGTKEFIKRNGQFTVNIALSYQHHTVMGVIYAPATGELYYASQGNGAYLKKNDIVQQLRVTDRQNDLRCVASGSHGCAEMDELIETHEIKHIVRMGSSLKGCLVAKGDAEIYFRFNPTMEWDTAAMQCIVEESGGIFRQMDDSEMLYNRLDSRNNMGFYIINSVKNRLR